MGTGAAAAAAAARPRGHIDGVASVPSVPRVEAGEQHVLLALPLPRVDPNCAHGKRRTTVLEPFPVWFGSRKRAEVKRPQDLGKAPRL
jgi:hypothetical protein